MTTNTEHTDTTNWGTWEARLASVRGNLEACLRDYTQHHEWSARHEQIADFHTLLAGLARIEGRALEDYEIYEDADENSYDVCEETEQRTECDEFEMVDTVPSCDDSVHCYWIRELSDLNHISPRQRLPKELSYITYGNPEVKEDTIQNPSVWKALKAVYTHGYQTGVVADTEAFQSGSTIEIQEGRIDDEDYRYIKACDISVKRSTRREYLDEIAQFCEYWAIPFEICFRC